MQETAQQTATWFVSQGVLGVWALVATVAAVWLFRDRDRIIARQVAKATTDGEVNKASAARLEGLVQQQGQVMQGLVDALGKKRSPGRRPTVSGHE